MFYVLFIFILSFASALVFKFIVATQDFFLMNDRIFLQSRVHRTTKWIINKVSLVTCIKAITTELPPWGFGQFYEKKKDVQNGTTAWREFVIICIQNQKQELFYEDVNDG